MWKVANITPIHKKELSTYICGNLLEKSIFKDLYILFDSNYLISKNLFFTQVISTVNKCVDFVDEIHK